LVVVMVKGSRKHVFARKRPGTGGNTVAATPPRDTHYRDLPGPTGKAPFRVDLKDVLDARTYAGIVKAKSLTFHVNGDMGGIMYAVPQELVEAARPRRAACRRAPGLVLPRLNGDVDRPWRLPEADGA
jgi:hypothetical protein